MSIDYKQLQLLVKEAMFTNGGINEPSAPEGVPHRMPAADKDTPEQYKGDPEANDLYDLALTAREATEQLVEALDEPIYDDAYEQAFKASACLRKALNSLEGSGAHPMPDQRVVAAPEYQQRFSGGSGGDYAGGGMIGMGGGDFGGLEEQEELKGFGSKTVTKQAQAKGELEKSKSIAKGDTLGDVTNRERSMLVQIEKVLSDIAEKDDLIKYRTTLETILKKLLAASNKQQGK